MSKQETPKTTFQTNVEKYKKNYKDLDAYLRNTKRLNKKDKKHILLEDFFEDNREKYYFSGCRCLRNIFEHYDLEDFPMTIDEAFFENFENKVKEILQSKASSIGQRPYCVFPNYNLLKACKKMVDENYTNAPILDKNNNLIGMLSVYSCFQIIQQIKDFKNSVSDLTIADILDFCKIDNQPDVEYVVVKKHTKIFDLKKQMLNQDKMLDKNNTKRIEAFLVQDKNGKIIRIITREDLFSNTH